MSFLNNGMKWNLLVVGDFIGKWKNKATELDDYLVTKTDSSEVSVAHSLVPHKPISILYN